MIQVSKEETIVIRERLPFAHIVKTCKGNGKKGKYYVSEEPKIIKLITEMRKSKNGKQKNR